MNPKVWFVIIGLMVLLAIVAMAMGASSGSSAPLDFSAGGLERLASGLVSDQGVKPSDIGSAIPAACLDLFQKGSLVMESGGTCVFSIKASDAASRSLAVVLTQGTQLQADARLPVNSGGDRMQVKKTLKVNDSFEVQFLKDGGTVILVCAGVVGGNCALALK